MSVRALTMQEIEHLPVTVDLTTAARCWGFSRTHAYELVRKNAFPCRVIRVGGAWRITRHDLLISLGLDPATSRPLAAADAGKTA